MESINSAFNGILQNVDDVALEVEKINDFSRRLMTLLEKFHNDTAGSAAGDGGMISSVGFPVPLSAK